MSVIHGCAHVAGKYPTSTSFLTNGGNAVLTVGFPVLKLYFSSNYNGAQNPAQTDYPNQNWSATYTNLTSLVQDPAFHSTIIKFGTIVANTFSFANNDNVGSVTATATNLANEYTEYYNLTQHLLTTYSNKTFILQNWEGDWQLLNSFDPYSEIPYYRQQRVAAFYNAKYKAIRDATLATPSTSRVYSAIELNRVLDKFGLRLVRDVLPLIKYDLISLSIYEAINTWGNNQSEAIAYIQTLLPKVIKTIQSVAGPSVPIYIGEFSWPENRADFTSKNLDVGGLIQTVIDICNDFNIKYDIYWEIWSNEGTLPDDIIGFYIIKPDGSLSAAGTKYRSIL